jgi:hypothetical protein
MPLIFVALVLTLVSGCATCRQIDPKQQLIMKLDNYMIPLAKAVDVVVDKLPPEAKDQEIFQKAVERSGDPGLLKPFDGYVLKAKITGDTAVILLCYPDGKEGIIEDVTCTARPDTYRPSGSPCTYFLDAKLVCSAP